MSPEYHPDQSLDLPRERATLRFQRIVAAKDILLVEIDTDEDDHSMSAEDWKWSKNGKAKMDKETRVRPKVPRNG